MACAPCFPTVRPGGPVGRRVALPRSVPVPSLGRQQSGCPWRRSGHRGRGPHTAPVRARLLSPGVVCVAPWRVGAGLLVLSGSCGSRRLGRGSGPCSGLPLGRRGPARGGGIIPCPPGGVGAGAPVACGRVGGGVGGRGAGSRRGCPTLSLGGAACGSLPSPPFNGGAFPCGVRVRSGSRGSPVRRVRPSASGPALRGGGGEGRPVNRPPRGSNRAGLSLCPPWSGKIAGVFGDAQVMGGAPPILLWFVVACCPWAWPVHCSGALVRVRPPVVTPAGASGGGRGGAQRADPAATAPGRHGSFGGRGDVPSAPGGAEGRRPRGPQAGGGAGGRGEGGPCRCLPPPCPVGWPVAPVPVTLRLRRTPLGYTRAVRVARRSWAPVAARSAAGGSV